MTPAARSGSRSATRAPWRSGGVPAHAGIATVVRRVADYAQVPAARSSTRGGGQGSGNHGVDSIGLGHEDRKILECIISHFGGGGTWGERPSPRPAREVRTIEDIYEPYLIPVRVLKRTPSRRVVTVPRPTAHRGGLKLRNASRAARLPGLFHERRRAALTFTNKFSEEHESHRPQFLLHAPARRELSWQHLELAAAPVTCRGHGPAPNRPARSVAQSSLGLDAVEHISSPCASSATAA